MPTPRKRPRAVVTKANLAAENQHLKRELEELRERLGALEQEAALPRGVEEGRQRPPETAGPPAEQPDPEPARSEPRLTEAQPAEAPLVERRKALRADQMSAVPPEVQRVIAAMEAFRARVLETYFELASVITVVSANVELLAIRMNVPALQSAVMELKAETERLRRAIEPLLRLATGSYHEPPK